MMRPRKLLLVLATLPLLTVWACGGGGGTEEATPPAEEDNGGAAEQAGTAPDLSNAGSISGSITYSGDAPSAEAIQMAADPYCQSAHSDAVTRNPVRVNDSGGLMNVVVHVTGGLENYTFETPSESVSLDQQGCLYQPHVVALQTNQTLVIKNSDDTLHNINFQPRNNEAFNIAQPVAGMTMEKQFPNPEVGIPARCDVHPWMSAFVNVFGHPYYAISTEDGSFSIADLPPGDYVIEAWHETLGTQTQNVTVGENAEADASFTFEG